MKKQEKDYMFEKVLTQYEKLVGTISGLEKKGKTMPYTSLNGHMFSFLDKEGNLSLRLPAETRETFIKKYRAELSVQYGHVMKEYIIVPKKLLNKITELQDYFQISYDYVATLKPKLSKKN